MGSNTKLTHGMGTNPIEVKDLTVLYLCRSIDIRSDQIFFNAPDVLIKTNVTLRQVISLGSQL